MKVGQSYFQGSHVLKRLKRLLLLKINKKILYQVSLEVSPVDKLVSKPVKSLWESYVTTEQIPLSGCCKVILANASDILDHKIIYILVSITNVDDK